MAEKSKNNKLAEIPFYRKLIYRFLGLFFRYLYNDMAWCYDFVSTTVSLGKWKTWTETSVPYLIGPKILELGHGPGHLIVRLLCSGKQAFGIDISPHMGRLTAARLYRAQLPVNISTAESQYLPFSAELFDHIVATFPTEYILDEKTLEEVSRVLKPGGSMIVVPVAWITGKGLLDRAASLLFQITGQAPKWDRRALEPATNAGFKVSTDRISLDSSDVQIIIASKIKPE